MIDITKRMYSEISSCLVSSCSPFEDSIKIEEEDGKIFVKWSCDTLGFHQLACSSIEEAEKEVERLKGEAKLSPLYSVNYCKEKGE